MTVNWAPSPGGWFGRHKVLSTVLGMLLGIWIIGIGASVLNPDQLAKTSAEDPGSTIREPSGTSPGESETPAPKTPRTYRVADVVDGDTIDLANGEAVRLVGMDSPERGDCGYEKATRNLQRLVLGEQVTLTRARGENRDRYDRLLRYVNLGQVDVGLQQIKRGLAIAKYDSRDGYGAHPREQRYISADKAAKDFKCQPKPQPFAGTPEQHNCAPGYDPCIPPYPPDLNCADVGGPITVTGSDPHGLDADDDGTACEP